MTQKPKTEQPLIENNVVDTNDLDPEKKFLGVEYPPEKTALETQENLTFALVLAGLGFRVFPCVPYKKNPLTRSGFHDATTNQQQIKNWFRRWPNANLALATGLYGGTQSKTLVVLDFDAKINEPNESLNQLERVLGVLPDTVIAHTPNGGFHLYFQTDEKLNSSVGLLGVGVDVRAIGGYVLVPPSKISVKTDCLGGYVWHNEIGIQHALIAKLPPAWVKEILACEGRSKALPEGTKTTQAEGGFDRMVRLAVADVEGEEEPIFEGQRNDTLSRLGLALRRRNVPQTSIRKFLLDENSSRCKPPLPNNEVEKILKSICRYKPFSHVGRTSALAQNKAFDVWGEVSSPQERPANQEANLSEQHDGFGEGESESFLGADTQEKTFFGDTSGPNIDPQQNAKPLVLGPIEAATSGDVADWHKLLILNKEGRILPCLANVELLISHNEVFTGAIWFDEIRQEIFVIHRLKGDKTPCRLSDNFELDVTIYIQRKLGVLASVETVHNAIVAIASRTKRNPVVDEIERARFSGECWLDRWLVECFGVEDKPIYREFGRLWLQGLVARAYLPGVKFDTVLVLSGLQGAGKSSAFKILGGDYFTDDVGEFADKDTKTQVARNWLVELAELGALRSSEIELVKAFVTRQIDQFRPPYGRNVIDVPRHCVFAATTNKERFLRDETGNRRFWVVRVGPKIDLEKLLQIRETLFAEARENLRQFYPLKKRQGEIERFLTLDESLWGEAAEIAEESSVEDSWQDQIAEYTRNREETTLDAIFEHMGIKNDRRGKYEQMRASDILKKLGFEQKRREVFGVKTTYYIRKKRVDNEQ